MQRFNRFHHEFILQNWHAGPLRSDNIFLTPFCWPESLISHSLPHDTTKLSECLGPLAGSIYRLNGC
jgi:hypothetical protein